MKLENKDRIISALKELETYKSNLYRLKEFKEEIAEGEAGILIQKHSDGSGLRTNHVYDNENYNVDMNTEMIDSIISITEKYMQKLKEEIETL